MLLINLQMIDEINPVLMACHLLFTQYEKKKAKEDAVRKPRCAVKYARLYTSISPLSELHDLVNLAPGLQKQLITLDTSLPHIPRRSYIMHTYMHTYATAQC